MRLLSVLAVCVVVRAQLEHSYDLFVPRTAKFESPTITLPPQDNYVLRMAEIPVGKMYKFGQPVTVNAGLEDGKWTDVSGGHVWSISFASQNAQSLNLRFKNFHIPEGGAMWIYGKDAEIQGAYTHENNYDSNEFGNWPIVTDRITIEYFQPTEVKAQPSFFISEVIHGYREQPEKRACGSSGSCNKNSACDGDFGGLHSNQIRGGAMILSAGGSGYCSGSMINTVGNTGRQLFLTAAHCGTSHSAIKFNFASAQCTPTDCPAGNNVGNLDMLVRRTESDFALLEVREQIPASWNVFLSGFSASSQPTTSLSCIHHPSGDVQKMAYAYKEPQYDRWSGTGPSTHWRVSSWDNLTTTEPGSSGSPLFDAQQRIIGQLHGGTASCGNPAGYDTYGGIYFSWNDGLSEILGDGSSTDEVDGIDLNTARKY